MSIRYNLRLYYGIVLKKTKNVPSPCAEKSTFDDPFTRNREACVFSLVQSTAIKYASLFLSNFFISRLFLFPAGTVPPTQISPTMYKTSGLQDTYEDIEHRYLLYLSGDRKRFENTCKVLF